MSGTSSEQGIDLSRVQGQLWKQIQTARAQGLVTAIIERLKATPSDPKLRKLSKSKLTSKIENATDAQAVLVYLNAIGFVPEDDTMTIDDGGVTKLLGLLAAPAPSDGKWAAAASPSKASASAAVAADDDDELQLEDIDTTLQRTLSKQRFTTADIKDGKDRDAKDAKYASPEKAKAPATAAAATAAASPASAAATGAGAGATAAGAGASAAPAAAATPTGGDKSQWWKEYGYTSEPGALYQEAKLIEKLRSISGGSAHAESMLAQHLMNAVASEPKLTSMYQDESPVFQLNRGLCNFSLPNYLAAHPTDDNTSAEAPAFRSWVLQHISDVDLQAQLEKTGGLNRVPGTSNLTVLRTDGDGNCLAHAALLATYGIQDRMGMLRGMLDTTMSHRLVTPRLLDRWVIEQQTVFGLDAQTEAEYKKQFDVLLKDLKSPTAYLESIHVLALAHTLRRPIIVYGSQIIAEPEAVPTEQSDTVYTGGASAAGLTSASLRKAKLRDALGQQENTVRGIYLPILCKHSCQTMQCPRNLSKRPVLLCYSARADGNGHFSAVVPTEGQNPSPHLIPLDTMTAEGKRQLLPLRFIRREEIPSAKKVLEQFFGVEELQTTAEGSMCVRLSISSLETSEVFWTSYLRTARQIYKQMGGAGADGKAAPTDAKRPGVAAATATAAAAIAAAGDKAAPAAGATPAGGSAASTPKAAAAGASAAPAAAASAAAASSSAGTTPAAATSGTGAGAGAGSAPASAGSTGSSSGGVSALASAAKFLGAAGLTPQDLEALSQRMAGGSGSGIGPLPMAARAAGMESGGGGGGGGPSRGAMAVAAAMAGGMVSGSGGGGGGMGEDDDMSEYERQQLDYALKLSMGGSDAGPPPQSVSVMQQQMVSMQMQSASGGGGGTTIPVRILSQKDPSSGKTLVQVVHAQTGQVIPPEVVMSSPALMNALGLRAAPASAIDSFDDDGEEED